MPPRCLSSCSYIKPQLCSRCWSTRRVVYHLVPTSNHNFQADALASLVLFIILFLHQTTTIRDEEHQPPRLFIILFLHQTTTEKRYRIQNTELFIILFLHQTTTIQKRYRIHRSCLSSCSYIKPQQKRIGRAGASVVYHLVPTSNHNNYNAYFQDMVVVYHLVPTSNHNKKEKWKIALKLFIILFLHQTTTAHSIIYSACLLFIILFLHQTTTLAVPRSAHDMLFIILFLHQTTTLFWY